MREIEFICGYTEHASGSVLASFGGTKVICTVFAEEGVPNFRSGDEGWLTAEYSMLPGSTFTRKKRRTISGELDGRTVEIQRLIGRSLRSAINLSEIGPRTLYVDCDVIQADGGTRTVAISGAYLALRLAIDDLMQKGYLWNNPLEKSVAAVSVGMVDDKVVVDLSFQQDSRAQVDFNVVMDDQGNYVEVQGTGEKISYSRDQLDEMLDRAKEGIEEILRKQEQAYEDYRSSQPQPW
ncbi:MAG: ribonuclease PH [Tissierellia bacterium]|nr:ribonuclease PH [Tissierellia bacterium]